MKKRMLSWLLAIVMVVGLIPGAALTAGAATATGTTGDCTWTFDDATGTLTVSGTGAMADSYTSGSQPWYAYKDSITTVIVEKGVTTISPYAFYTFPAVETVKIAGSVTAIGQNAFYSCSNLTTVEYYGSSAPQASDNAFFGSYVVVKVLTTYEDATFCGKVIRKNLDAANEPVPSAPAAYTVTVDSAITNGTVAADKASAAEGDTVTLTVTPAEGYEIDTVAVNGTAIIAKEGVYSFTMPAKDVTVTATFAKKAAAEGSGTEGDPYILHDGDNSFDVEKALWHYFQYTAAAAGTLSVTVGTSTGKWYSRIGSSFKWDTQPEAVEMTAGETYLIGVRIYTDSSDKWGGCAGSVTLDVQFASEGSDEPAVYNVSLTADKETAVLGESITLTAAVTDGDGNPVEDAAVDWEATAGANFEPVEDEPLKVTVTPEAAGEYEITVIYDPTYGGAEGDEVTATVTVTFTAPPVVTITDVVYSGEHVVADSENKTYTVTIPEGASYADATVTVTGANLDRITEEDRTNGTYRIKDSFTSNLEPVTYDAATGNMVWNSRMYAEELYLGSHSIQYSVDGGEAWTETGWTLVVKLEAAPVVTYKVNVAVYDNGGGTVTADKTEAAAGETVTLTVTAAAAHILSFLSLGGGNGENISDQVTDGKLTFTMPEGDVEVYGYFGWFPTVTVTDEDGNDIPMDGTGVLAVGKKYYVSVEPAGYHDIDWVGQDLEQKMAWRTLANGEAFDLTPELYLDNYARFEERGLTLDGISLQISNENGESVYFDLRIEASSATYTVTVDSAITNGTVTADKAEAKEGDTVTLTVIPDTGYMLDVITVTDESGAPVTVTNGQFTMPADDVTVTAAFKKIPAETPVITDPQGADLIYGYTEGSISITAAAPAGHTLTYQWYNSDGTAIDGATAAAYAIPTGKDAGTYAYYCVVTATRTDNGETAAATSPFVPVVVSKLAVAEPTVKGSYTYTGSEITVELEGVESFMTVVSGTKGTNAGDYEVVIELDGNHKWDANSDGKVQWAIGKAQAVITVDTTC